MNAENGQKLLLNVLAIFTILLVGFLLRKLAGLLLSGEKAERAKFRTRQGISLFTAIILILTLISIWFNDPTRLAVVLGTVSAGLAFALQKVVSSIILIV